MGKLRHYRIVFEIETCQNHVPEKQMTAASKLFERSLMKKHVIGSILFTPFALKQLTSIKRSLVDVLDEDTRQKFKNEFSEQGYKVTRKNGLIFKGE